MGRRRTKSFSAHVSWPFNRMGRCCRWHYLTPMARSPASPSTRLVQLRLVLRSSRFLCATCAKAFIKQAHALPHTHTHRHGKDKQGLHWLWEFLIDIGSGQARSLLFPPEPRQRVNYSTRYPAPCTHYQSVPPVAPRMQY